MISCRTMCVHFPDGLSSLLPDLLCVVLHCPVICVSSRTLCRCIHLYISHRSALSLSHLVFCVSSPPLLGATDPLVCAPYWDSVRIYSDVLSFFFCSFILNISIHISIYLSIHLSTYTSIHPCIYPSIYLCGSCAAVPAV